MKKWNFVLPLSAILFVVAAAFASNGTDGKDAVTYYFRDAGLCEPCLSAPVNESECQVRVDGEICECAIGGGQVASAGIDPMASDCKIVRRPPQP